MNTPASLLPPDEAERLQTLRHYDVLGAPLDDVFHELVKLAAQLFNQPLAFMAIVDEHEVCFPALHGAAHLPPVPRAHALCSTAILFPHAVAYENLAAAAQDGVDAPAIRAALADGAAFYAAAPLRMPDRNCIGVLCLMGPTSRPFSPAEEGALEAIAQVASLGLAVRHLCRATPELGPDLWASVAGRLSRDLHELQRRVRELLKLFGQAVPVPFAVLRPVQRRLQALSIVLAQ
ncbi:MAG TPA: GAF domain-containing protein [Hymenobacter sp.]|jgi:GAF domain-containing protein|uniref:GAF domain-containing protein n=1 Tax=Hymenobacter sp. TaxID=1898978 RepID=UPI002EDA5DCE